MGEMAASGEPDFMIHGIYSFHLLGRELWITTTAAGMGIVTVVILIFAFLAGRKLRAGTMVPGSAQNALEYGVELLEKMTEGIMGNGRKRLVKCPQPRFLIP